MRRSSASVAIYAGKGVSAGSLVTSLKSSFPDGSLSVRFVDACQIKQGVLNRDIAAFILPGVVGESSGYRRDLGHDGFEKIRNYIESGGVYAGLCAGAYLAAKRFYYLRRADGELKIVDSPLALFNGTARGPIVEYTDRHLDQENPWADHAVARLAFNESSGCTISAACYVRGPWLELSQEALSDSSYKIIARYNDVLDKPIAIASRTIGNGKAIFCGVVPEVSGHHVQAETLPKNRWYGYGAAYARRLRAVEDQRLFAWNCLLQEMNLK